jgi:hypothetical protein
MNIDFRIREPRLNPAIVLACFFAILVFDALSTAAARGFLERVWTDLVARPSGPFGLRFWIQPIVAASLGIAAGISDARTCRSRYLWTMLTNKQERHRWLAEGIMASSRVMVVGMVLDAIYQLVVFKMFYPLEALLVAVLLAFIPYVFICGPATRIARIGMARRPDQAGVTRAS